MHIVIFCLFFVSLIIITCKTIRYRINFDILNKSSEIIMFEFLKKNCFFVPFLNKFVPTIP